MNHEPFEDWLLEDPDQLGQSLDAHETASLSAHLETCESCRQLALALREVESELRVAPVLAPAAGFSSRFQVRLEAEQRRLHKRQSLAVLYFLIGGATLLFGSLLILALPLIQTPNVLVWTFLYRLIGIVSLVEAAQGVLRVLFQTITGVISPAGWVILAGVMSELGVLWVVSLRLLTHPRSVTQ